MSTSYTDRAVYRVLAPWSQCEGRPAYVYPLTPRRFVYRRNTTGSGRFPWDVSIVDWLVVPAHLEPGDYVLGFRWDCEATAQVWSSCADVTVAARRAVAAPVR